MITSILFLYSYSLDSNAINTEGMVILAKALKNRNIIGGVTVSKILLILLSVFHVLNKCIQVIHNNHTVLYDSVEFKPIVRI